MFEVEITAEGARHLARLPEKVRAAAVELMLGPIAAEPSRVGKPLVGDLSGLRSARRGDYRVVYEIDEAERVVIVHRVQHRRDVYRPRRIRLRPPPGSGRVGRLDYRRRAGDT